MNFDEHLQEELISLNQDVVRNADAAGMLSREEFFSVYSKLVADAGDCPDELEPAMFKNYNNYEVDGYHFELDKDLNPTGDLYIATCDYSISDVLRTINSEGIKLHLSSIISFANKALDINKKIESQVDSDEYHLTMLIRNNTDKIKRIKFLIFTNAVLDVRTKVVTSSNTQGVEISTNVIDLKRYSNMSRLGHDSVEINITDYSSSDIHCLKPSSGSSGIESYLFIMSGNALANIYHKYGSRLLEQNVRTYLRNQSKVNKGILETIKLDPAMFLAYNNGITATASTIECNQSPDGSLRIDSLKDFQIVNGGQTTASIYYARQSQKLDLSKVFVQIKLSVVNKDKLHEVVPKISRYANSQNKVQDTDFVANNEVQIKIKELSKVNTPLRPGELHSTRWFYERMRGEYRNKTLYDSKSQKKKFEAEYPKSQLIEKVDLAKWELSFECLPHIVSKGAQKAFQFYLGILKDYHIDQVNEDWFKSIVAKGIIFRGLDSAIAKTDWYHNKKALKAQNITYTIAQSVHQIHAAGFRLNFSLIWEQQRIDGELLRWFLRVAEGIHTIINQPPSEDALPSEFCKKESCWTEYVKGNVKIPLDTIHEYLTVSKPISISYEELNPQKAATSDFENLKLKQWGLYLFQTAKAKGWLSVKNQRALKSLMNGEMPTNKSHKNALNYLIERMEDKNIPKYPIE